ncbi:MAG: nicotinamide riboside transporter PnuC [Acidimicrobiales bacterium]
MTTTQITPVEEAEQERTPWWGTRRDQRDAVVATLAAAAVTGVYVALSHWIADLPTTRLEVVGTITSMACVWITRRQNVLAMPLGLASVVAMGAFFFEIDLVGQGWLHLGYYVPIQVVGWWYWIRGGVGGTDRPVAWMTWPVRVAVFAAIGVATLGLARLFEQLHGPTDRLLWDSSIVAASVAAQALLTAKRTEAWWLWLIPVNVSAVALYVVSGAYMFAALYVLYLVLATLGLRDWTNAWRAQQRGVTPAQARRAT